MIDSIPISRKAKLVTTIVELDPLTDSVWATPRIIILFAFRFFGSFVLVLIGRVVIRLYKLQTLLHTYLQLKYQFNTDLFATGEQQSHYY